MTGCLICGIETAAYMVYDDASQRPVPQDPGQQFQAHFKRIVPACVHHDYFELHDAIERAVSEHNDDAALDL